MESKVRKAGSATTMLMAALALAGPARAVGYHGYQPEQDMNNESGWVTQIQQGEGDPLPGLLQDPESEEDYQQQESPQVPPQPKGYSVPEGCRAILMLGTWGTRCPLGARGER